MSQLEIAIWNYLVLHCSVGSGRQAHYEHLASWLSTVEEPEIWSAVASMCNRKLVHISEDGFSPIIDGIPMAVPQETNKGLPRALFLEGNKVIH